MAVPQVPKRITEEMVDRYYQSLIADAIKRASNLAYARCSMVISLLLMGYKIPYNNEMGNIAFYAGLVVFVLGAISTLVNRGETVSEI